MKTKAQLVDECLLRGIHVGQSYTVKQLIGLLAQHTLQDYGEPSWGLKRRLEIPSPMLCFPFKQLKDHEQQVVLHAGFWEAEYKFDGVRMLIFYHPDEGYTFFSRHHSEVDYLPIEYTNNILLSDLKTPKFSFVLDAEVLATSVIDESYTRLSSTVAMLSMDGEDSRHLQQRIPLEFQVFDVLQIGGDHLTSEPLKARKRALHLLLGQLGGQLSAVPTITQGKERYFYDVLRKGGEGVVLKNMYAPYNPTTSRDRAGWVKLKRTMSQALGRDIDAFISGAAPASQGKLFEDLIGSVEVSVYVDDKPHVIGYISGMPHHIREALTSYVEGEPALNPKYLGKVITINGQDISNTKLRFSHCVAQSWEFRRDKRPEDCVLTREFLLSQVL